MDEQKDITSEQNITKTSIKRSKFKEYFGIFRKGALTNNPVLVKGFALAPVLFVSTTLKNGVLLAVATFVVLCFMSVFSSLLYLKIPEYLRAAVVTLAASIFVTGVAWGCFQIAPNITNEIGIFMPLIAVNGIILARADGFHSKSKLLPSLIDGAANGFGFAIAIIIISTFREIIGHGKLYEKPLPGLTNFSFDFIKFAPGAFLTLAVFLAIVQNIRQRKSKKKREAR
jgi:electron transport complex protein RnfE